jgi:hypothetical protein
VQNTPGIALVEKPKFDIYGQTFFLAEDGHD